MTDASDAAVLALREQLGELERRLGNAQDDLVAAAYEIGALRDQILTMQGRLVSLSADRDAWRAQAERSWWRRLTG